VIGKLHLVGLTGGIGSGKSTVGRMVRELGVPVLDADRIAREVVAPGQPAHAAIAAAWPHVLAPDGRIDRKQLAALVFSDPGARTRLEAITHPRIREQAMREAAALERQGHRLAFYEAALLVEAGRRDDLDRLVVVTADEDQQIARVMARDHSSREEALARLRAQLPLSEKRKQATDLIDNGGDLAATQHQVEALVARLRASF
jgi:dephospho-CoA kinase